MGVARWRKAERFRFLLPDWVHAMKWPEIAAAGLARGLGRLHHPDCVSRRLAMTAHTTRNAWGRPLEVGQRHGLYGSHNYDRARCSDHRRRRPNVWRL